MTSTMNPIVGEALAINPFPGLRSFGSEESHLFFGREAEIDEVLRQLGDRRFVSVLGSSGSGKSSLVRAGLVPALLAGGSTLIGSNCVVATMQPGRTPLRNLAAALARRRFTPEDDAWDSELAMVEAALRRSGLGLIDAVKLLALDDRPVLLVVDQFEELFRFADSSQSISDDATAFVKLLVEVAHSRDHKVHVVLTMRSDFLGRCSDYHGLPETIDDTLHLVRRLTRRQLRQAIEGPVLVARGAISPALLQRLLNDASADPDILPLLQHSLQRSWDLWQEGAETGEINIDHYEKAGGLEHALSIHANEAFAELDPAQKEATERIFKRLVEVESNGQKVRRPTSIAELAEVSGVSHKAVIASIAPFVQGGRSFVVVSDDDFVDISHESLIRRWDRLSGWVDQENEAHKAYERLADSARRYEDGSGALLRGRDLSNARQWWDEARPNQAWAARYSGDFDSTEAYLQRSGDRARMRILASVVLFAAVAGALIFSYVRTSQLSAEREEQLRPLALVTDAPNDIQISGLEVTEVTDKSAVVSFSTDQCSNVKWVVHNPSTIEIGGGLDSAGNCVTDHRLTLGRSPFTRKALNPGQTYTVNVAAIAANATQSEPSSLEFTTLPEITTDPVISNLAMVDITGVSAKVQFDSDQCVGSAFAIDGVVEFRWGYPGVTDLCDRSHWWIFDGSPDEPLTPGTEYTATVSAVLADGRMSSQDISFKTAAE